ncbi:hypothetical protein GCM10010279_44420 [Streptomyces mutabilis]|nr:hypothetical protein GCM10010279_44420 [Streptomyces mutabilis]
MWRCPPTSGTRPTRRRRGLPVFAFTTADDVTSYDVFDVSRLREGGWLVPACTFPPHRQDLSALRVVYRNGFSADVADLLVEELERLLPQLRRQPHPLTRDKGAATGCHHQRLSFGSRRRRLPTAAEPGEPPHRQREEHRHEGERPPDRRPHVPRLAAGAAEQVAYGGGGVGHRVPPDERAQPARHGVGGGEGVGEEADRPDQYLYRLHRLRLAGDRGQVDADPQHREPEQQEQAHRAQGLSPYFLRAPSRVIAASVTRPP